MGLLIAQMRLAQINNYRADLEYQIQLVSSTKMDLSSQINDMVALGSDMDPDRPEMKALEKKKERLKASFLELLGGFEPPTSSLPRTRSTN